MKNKAANIDAYIAGFPEPIQDILQQIRTAIKKEVPGCGEKISYDMPTITLNNKNLVYFAAFKAHIGFYGAPTGVKEFAEDFSGYKTGRGSVQFPLNKPIPSDLIRKIVHYRVQQISGKTN